MGDSGAIHQRHDLLKHLKSQRQTQRDLRSYVWRILEQTWGQTIGEQAGKHHLLAKKAKKFQIYLRNSKNYCIFARFSGRAAYVYAKHI